jgi:ribonucleoside-diphosphate reductase beta chain
MLKILNTSVNSDKLFFGESGHGISRYDSIRYPVLDKVDQKMKSFFWRPHEVNVSEEKRSFNQMNEIEQFVFTSNLKRQILLDSIQGRAPALVFLEHCTDPTLENCLLTWSFFESIHSESYTHIIRAIYPDPKVIVDDMPNIKPIVDCADDISASYDKFRETPTKENLYLALISAYALEGIRFYVSFACTFSFLERAMVEGSAKIIKLIARDEAQHLALVQHILKILPQDDPEFVDIIANNREKVIDIFNIAAVQEKEWARYLFENGSILGLNTEILSEYVDWLYVKRLKAIGITPDIKVGSHPLPWLEKHFGSSNTQVAPQEVEIASYLASSITNDIGGIDLSNLLGDL